MKTGCTIKIIPAENPFYNAQKDKKQLQVSLKNCCCLDTSDVRHLDSVARFVLQEFQNENIFQKGYFTYYIGFTYVSRKEKHSTLLWHRNMKYRKDAEEYVIVQ